MKVEQLREYLDGLIAEVRGGFRSVDAAVLEIAGAIDRYGQAEREIIAIGDTLRAMRQPVPLHSQPGQPLPPEMPTPAQLAEAEEQRRWQAFREQAGMGNGRADQ